MVRVHMAKGSRARPGHNTVIPSKSCCLFQPPLENGEGPGVRKFGAGADTKPLPLITPWDRELTPYWLTGIPVSWF